MIAIVMLLLDPDVDQHVLCAAGPVLDAGVGRAAPVVGHGGHESTEPADGHKRRSGRRQDGQERRRKFKL